LHPEESQLVTKSSWRSDAQIGFGQWFRYFTGCIQVLGGVLVLIPRTFVCGILMIACTIAGAAMAWIFLLGSPLIAVIPAALLGVVLFACGEEVIEPVERMRKRWRVLGIRTRA